MNNTICKRCILDTSIPELKFDSEGICNYCNFLDNILLNYPIGLEGHKKIKEHVRRIQKTSTSKYPSE